MDNPFILLALAIALLVIFYFLFRRLPAGATNPDGNGGTSKDEMFSFDPQRDGIKPVSRRKVTVTAPAQTIGGKKHKLRVEAKELPTLAEIQVPKGKGIDALIVLVIDDRVLFADSDQEVYEFNPPLTYTIEYTKEDAAAAPKDGNGAPRLSIVTGYPADNGWKFERLDTQVEPNTATGGGTLTAKLSKLYPKDPKWIGQP